MKIFKRLKIIKRWAWHVINRFGQLDAMRFAISGAICPCAFLEMRCFKCEFRYKRYYNFKSSIPNGCRYAGEWGFMTLGTVKLVKNKIRMILT